MKKLEISSTLSLPIDGVTQELAMLGRTGSGKSYAATKLAEEMLDAGAQIVALDPVGIWYGLRTAYSIPVFGGLHGDIPLEVGGGALIADLIVDRRISAVVDVSQFESDADKARFARDFAARFYFRQKQAPSPVHLFLEEAQEFVPQNPEREEGRMLHAFVRIAKLGRNFGIGATLLSQRPQEVNKKALNQTECLFAFQMTGPQERDTIAKWATSKGVDENLDEILPSLEVGQAHVWSPQGSKLVFESGTAAVRQPFQSKAAIERAHTALHAQARPAPAAKPAPAPKPTAPVQAGELTISGPMQKILNTLASFEALGVQEGDRNQIALFSGASPTSSSYANNLSALSSAGLIHYPTRGRVQLTEAGRAIAVNDSVFSSLDELHSTWIGKVGGACGKILRALIDVYPNAITKDDLAGAVQASPASSSFANNLSTLRGLGVIDYPGRGLVIATPLLFPPI